MNWLSDLIDTIVPLGICVVLPVLITWLYFKAANNKVNKSTEIIMKALERSDTLEGIDTDKLMDALRSHKPSAQEILHKRLLRGCIFALIGLVGIIGMSLFYFNAPSDATEEAFVITFLSLIPIGLSLAIGFAYLLTYFVTRKSVEKE